MMTLILAAAGSIGNIVIGTVLEEWLDNVWSVLLLISCTKNTDFALIFVVH